MYPSRRCEALVNRDVCRVGQENSKVGQWEKATWPHLQGLAQNCPEAGIHFQGIFNHLHSANSGLMAYPYTETVVYNRKKDQESTTGKWFAELIKPNPWYNKVVPNVRVSKKHTDNITANTLAASIVSCLKTNSKTASTMPTASLQSASTRLFIYPGSWANAGRTASNSKERSWGISPRQRSCIIQEARRMLS